SRAAIFLFRHVSITFASRNNLIAHTSHRNRTEGMKKTVTNDKRFAGARCRLGEQAAFEASHCANVNSCEIRSGNWRSRRPVVGPASLSQSQPGLRQARLKAGGGTMHLGGLIGRNCLGVYTNKSPCQWVDLRFQAFPQ